MQATTTTAWMAHQSEAEVESPEVAAASPEVRRLQDELGELRRRLDSSPAAATRPEHAQFEAFRDVGDPKS